MSDLLIETKLTEDQREFAENVKRCGECLLNVINDILDFSKVEAVSPVDPIDLDKI